MVPSLPYAPVAPSMKSRLSRSLNCCCPPTPGVSSYSKCKWSTPLRLAVDRGRGGGGARGSKKDKPSPPFSCQDEENAWRAIPKTLAIHTYVHAMKPRYRTQIETRRDEILCRRSLRTRKTRIPRRGKILMGGHPARVAAGTRRSQPTSGSLRLVFSLLG